jgi:hypothetical protein
VRYGECACVYVCKIRENENAGSATKRVEVFGGGRDQTGVPL